jgi:hypothetical protein
MRATGARPANMRRAEGSAAVPAKAAAMSAKACEVSAATACSEAYSAVVPPKPAAMSAKAREMSATTMPAATAAVSATTAAMPSSAAAMPTSAATATAGVCLECEKRHDDEQYRGEASASR